MGWKTAAASDPEDHLVILWYPSWPSQSFRALSTLKPRSGSSSQQIPFTWHWAKHSRSCLPKAGVSSWDSPPSMLAAQAPVSLWISFYMVGNFKEICPNFITLIISILDISRGHEETLESRQGLSGPPFSPWWRQWQEFQMDSSFPKMGVWAELLGGRRVEDADSCLLRSESVQWSTWEWHTRNALGKWGHLHHRMSHTWSGGSGPARCGTCLCGLGKHGRCSFVPYRKQACRWATVRWEYGNQGGHRPKST